MKKRDILNIVVLLALVGIGFWRLYTRTYHYHDSRFLMDTVVTVDIECSRKADKAMMDSVFALMERYDKKLSYYNQESEVYAINHDGRTSVPISPEIHFLLDQASRYYTPSDSLYDVTVGAITELWHFDNPDKGTPPAMDSIFAALPYVGMNKISYTTDTLTRPVGLKVNFGSLAKGYIVDKAVEFLQNRVTRGYVDAGGNIRLFGQTDPVPVGVQHPRQPSQVINTLNLGNQAVATSGDYERYFMYNGQRFHHILSPKTGLPRPDVFSVTVVAPTGLESDILSTACFLLPPEKAVDLVKTIPEVDVMIYYRDPADSKGQDAICLKSAGMKKYLNDDEK